MTRAAFGFSDHSGWAVMAAVAEHRAGEFELLFRCRIETCPPELPRQPYHAVAEAGAERDTIELVFNTAASRAAAAMAEAARTLPFPPECAAIAVGRAAIPTDIDRILRAHALLHAAEGELYRDALSQAASHRGLRVMRFLNNEVRSEAAAALDWTLDALEAKLAGFGRAAGRPWTRDEKDAAAAALLALATLSSQ